MSLLGDMKDFLNFRQERKKRGLEIKKLEGEAKREASRLIVPAHQGIKHEDVVKYDPKLRRLEEHVREQGEMIIRYERSGHIEISEEILS